MGFLARTPAFGWRGGKKKVPLGWCLQEKESNKGKGISFCFMQLSAEKDTKNQAMGGRLQRAEPAPAVLSSVLKSGCKTLACKSSSSL